MCFLFQIFLIRLHCCLGEGGKKFSFLFHLPSNEPLSDTLWYFCGLEHQWPQRKIHLFLLSLCFFNERWANTLLARATAFVLLRCIILAVNKTWKTKEFNFLSQWSDLCEKPWLKPWSISSAFAGTTLALFALACFFWGIPPPFFIVLVFRRVLFLETTLEFFLWLPLSAGCFPVHQEQLQSCFCINFK